MTAVAPAGQPSTRATALPTVLTHYYRDEPLRTLSDLSDEDVDAVLRKIQRRRELDFRLTRAEYLPRRREIEREMREQLVRKGGRPRRERPHYFVLGTFSLYEEDAAMQSLCIPLRDVAPEVLSFTYTDSYFAYSEHNLRGAAIPPRPYHRQVFTLAELPALVAEHGLPGERWRTDPQRRFDVYIEAQLWDNGPVAHLIGREP